MAKVFGGWAFAWIPALVVLAGCSVSADTVRKSPAREIKEIEASKSDVAACLARKLKETSYEVTTSPNSVALRAGGITMRVFDLEESTHGTLVTMFVGSPFHVTQSKNLLEECRVQLEGGK